MNIFEYDDMMRNYQYPNQGGPATAYPVNMVDDPIAPSGGIMGSGNIGYQGVNAMPTMDGMSINNPMDGVDTSQPPKMPRNDDMSGFANYGMSTQAHPGQVPYPQMVQSNLQMAPTLPTGAQPMNTSIPALRNQDRLFGIFGVGRQQPGVAGLAKPALPPGGLMGYLQSLVGGING